jgi:hypothetical protein
VVRNAKLKEKKLMICLPKACIFNGRSKKTL